MRGIQGGSADWNRVLLGLKFGKLVIDVRIGLEESERLAAIQFSLSITSGIAVMRRRLSGIDRTDEQLTFPLHGPIGRD